MAKNKKNQTPKTEQPEAAPETKAAPAVPKTPAARTTSRPAAVKPAAQNNGEKTILRRPNDRDVFARLFDNVVFVGVFMLTMLYLEIVVRVSTGSSIGGRFFAYASLFAFAGGAIFALLCSFFKPKVNYILTLVLVWFLTVYFGVQMIYVKFFKDFFSWKMMAMAGNVTQFWRETLDKIVANLLPILLLLLPAILFTVFYARRGVRTLSWGVRAGAVVLAVVLFLTGVQFVKSHDEVFDDAYYYGPGFTVSECASRFGILTTLRLDTKYLIFGIPFEDDPDGPDGPGTLPEIPTLPVNPAESTEPPAPETQPVVIVTDPADDKIYVTIEGKKYELITEPDGKMWIDYDLGDGKTERREIVKDENGNYVLYIPPKPVDTSPNVLDIDWQSLIANAKGDVKSAHQFFSNREPTNKNAYTGMFKGKNLIFITVEGWSSACVDPVLTPTLYKMSTEGFHFQNYYCSMWGGSTATGEYANITGNYYFNTDCLRNSKLNQNYQKFTIANMLNKEGYLSQGYHNHTYEYYSRNISHVNFDYEWFGVGNWDVKFTDVWPKSDEEFGTNLLPFIPTDGTPFNFYLMTVGGHAHQTRAGNAQAKNNYMTVITSGLADKYTGQYAENALYYISSEYGVERLVKILSDYLESKGMLEDTVFVLAADHIPYEIETDDSLNEKILSELTGLPSENIYNNPELYHETLIIWSASMKKPVEVKKVCSAIDILPTLLNLYGLEYDSRLIIGHDILSDTQGFVPLNMSSANANRSSNNFITDYGIYLRASKTFVPAPGVELSQEDINNIVSFYNTLLTKYNTYSPFILDNDYYNIVFPNER